MHAYCDDGWQEIVKSMANIRLASHTTSWPMCGPPISHTMAANCTFFDEDGVFSFHSDNHQVSMSNPQWCISSQYLLGVALIFH